MAQLTLRDFFGAASSYGGSSPDGSLPVADVLSRTSCAPISAFSAVSSSSMSFLTGAGTMHGDDFGDARQKKAMYVNSPLRFCGVSALIE